MRNLTIEKLKRLPLNTKNNADVYDDYTFFYVDRSEDYYYECDLYFVLSNGEREISSGLRIDTSEMSKEEYLEELRDNLIIEIFRDTADNIYNKYENILIEKRKDNPDAKAFDIIINSKDVDEEDKRDLKDYKIFLLEVKIREITKDCQPLREKYSLNENTEEDDQKFFNYREEISKLKSKIEQIQYQYQTRASE